MDAKSGDNGTCPVLTAQNAYHWFTKMKLVLRGNFVYDVIEAEPKPPKLSLEEGVSLDREAKLEHEQARERWLKKDARALLCISSCVSQADIARIENCKTAREAWDKLKEQYRKYAWTHVYKFKKQMFNTTMDGFVWHHSFPACFKDK